MDSRAHLRAANCLTCFAVARHIAHRLVESIQLNLIRFIQTKSKFNFNLKELYLAKLYDGPKVDIWSLGVVLYVLVCGYLPFEAHVFNALRTQVINGTYKVPFFLSQDCNSLIGGMLNVDPSKRFSINDIINHKWLKFDNDIDLLSRSNNFGLISDDVNFIESLGK